MNRFKRALATTTAIIVCLAILATPVWLPLFAKYTQEQKYIETNIYSIDTIRSTGTRQLRTYYMICRPASTQEALKAQIDAYLSENDIVAPMIKKYEVGKVPKGIYLKFIKPSDCWPIGKIARADDEINCPKEAHLCSIYIDGVDPDNWRYEFFPENFEAKEQ